MPRPLLVALLIAVTAGCADPTGPVTGNDVLARTDSDSYTAAATVTITVDNRSGGRLYYGSGLCWSELQLRSGGQWTTVPTEFGPCPAMARALEDDATATLGGPLPGGLAAGEYRFLLFGISRDPESGDRSDITTNVFVVE